MRFVSLACARCGVQFTYTTDAFRVCRRYCSSCIAEARRHAVVDTRVKHAPSYVSDAAVHFTCVDCGGVFEYIRKYKTGSKRTLCDACRKRRRKLSYDTFNERRGCKVGVGRGHAQGHGSTHHTYKNGIGAYRSVVLADHADVVCSICGVRADAVGYSNICVHHVDGDRTNNTRANLVVVCKACHQNVVHPKYRDALGRYSKSEEK